MDLINSIDGILHQARPFESLGSLIVFIIIVAGTFIQISPIKINPWDFILGWIGERFNSGINKKINVIEQKVEKMENRLDEHIDYKKNEELKAMRRYIVDFVTDGVNGKKHTKESFQNALKACDEYQMYVRINHIDNGVINGSIEAIRTKYKQHLINADFAKEESL